MKQRITLTGKPIEGRPGWEAYDHRSLWSDNPIIGKPGTIIEETEEVAEGRGRVIRQRVLRVENSNETVLTDSVYPVYGD